MLKIIGHIGVIVATLGGYAAMGGKLKVLWQPFEAVIIVGAAMMAFLTANSMHAIKATMADAKAIYKKDKYGKAEYIELLSMLYLVSKPRAPKAGLRWNNTLKTRMTARSFKNSPPSTPITTPSPSCATTCA